MMKSNHMILSYLIIFEICKLIFKNYYIHQCKVDNHRPVMFVLQMLRIINREIGR